MIIAEIGLNHLGSNTLADLYVSQLTSTNIDGITFQVREPEYYKNKPKYKSLNYLNIFNQIHKSHKKVGIAIADINMIDYFESLNVDFYKVIRNDMVNHKLIEKLILTNKKLIVSTGTCSEKDIQNFINKYPNSNITLNHTQLSYNVNDCNLNSIKTLKSKFNVNISYGSHCDNHNVLYMALCYNPSDILFYVKGNKGFSYPDDKHAIVLDDVNHVVNNLKCLNQALGTGVKSKMKIKIK